MRFKIIVSNKEAEIEEDEIQTALKLIGKGGIVVLKHVIFNSAYFQAIVPDQEGNRQEAENRWNHIKMDKRTSEFAKLLAPKMKMLSDQDKTKALEETAKLERKNEIH